MPSTVVLSNFPHADLMIVSLAADHPISSPCAITRSTRSPRTTHIINKRGITHHALHRVLCSTTLCCPVAAIVQRHSAHICAPGALHHVLSQGLHSTEQLKNGRDALLSKAVCPCQYNSLSTTDSISLMQLSAFAMWTPAISIQPTRTGYVPITYVNSLLSG